MNKVRCQKRKCRFYQSGTSRKVFLYFCFSRYHVISSSFLPEKDETNACRRLKISLCKLLKVILSCNDIDKSVMQQGNISCFYF